MKLLKEHIKFYIKEYSLNLKEGLIKTTNNGKSVNIIKKQYPDFTILTSNRRNVIDIRFLNSRIDKNIWGDLLKLINNLGWFISFQEIQGETSNNHSKYNEPLLTKYMFGEDAYMIDLRLEAKYDFKVENIPDILYHISPSLSLDKIQTVGLVPKSRSKASEHPDRVFLGDNEDDLLRLSKMFYKKTGIKDWVLLKIDTKLIPDYFKIYKDPNYTKGYYTLNNIPPIAIEKVKNIEL